MKDIYKNPILHYILIPAIIIFWPLLVAVVYSPQAEKNWESEKQQYEAAQKTMKEILTLDPQRLEFAGSKEGAAKFDYATAVDHVAGSCGISSTNYKISSARIIKSGGQKSQAAQVFLKDLDITKFAKFLSTIQLRWGSLQCEKVKLTKKKGLPDVWDADLGFKYYY